MTLDDAIRALVIRTINEEYPELAALYDKRQKASVAKSDAAKARWQGERDRKGPTLPDMSKAMVKARLPDTVTIEHRRDISMHPHWGFWTVTFKHNEREHTIRAQTGEELIRFYEEAMAVLRDNAAKAAEPSPFASLTGLL